MKVAVAGTGNVAQYLFEELTNFGHEVVVFTRKSKPELKLEQRETDYSVESLLSVLKDIDALVSTIADFSNPPVATKIHFNMIEAVKQTPKCKSFIPSEWTTNVEDYPEQPIFLADHNKNLHARLSKEKDFRWTIISNSWFTDYIVPQSQRILRDVYPLWPMDTVNKVFTIYGPGTQVIDVTAVRDVAKAVAALVASPEPWEEYTYLSGDQLSWNDLFATMKRRDPAWTSQNKPLADTIQQIAANESPESVLIAHFEVQSYSGALTFPKEKVQRQREKYFQGIHFRSVEEILDAAAARPNEII